MSLPVGYFCLILHAHLPFVRHPENDDFLEEDWLYEAIGETYLPLLEVFLRLREEGIPYRLTLSISPTLAEMLSDPLLKKRFDERLEKRLELTAREVRRTSR
jgi:1,4-alpha-glucan branching enzyme